MASEKKQGPTSRPYKKDLYHSLGFLRTSGAGTTARASFIQSWHFGCSTVGVDGMGLISGRTRVVKALVDLVWGLEKLDCETPSAKTTTIAGFMLFCEPKTPTCCFQSHIKIASIRSCIKIALKEAVCASDGAWRRWDRTKWGKCTARSPHMAEARAAGRKQKQCRWLTCSQKRKQEKYVVSHEDFPSPASRQKVILQWDQHQQTYQAAQPTATRVYVSTNAPPPHTEGLFGEKPHPPSRNRRSEQAAPAFSLIFEAMLKQRRQTCKYAFSLISLDHENPWFLRPC